MPPLYSRAQKAHTAFRLQAAFTHWYGWFEKRGPQTTARRWRAGARYIRVAERKKASIALRFEATFGHAAIGLRASRRCFTRSAAQASFGERITGLLACRAHYRRAARTMRAHMFARRRQMGAHFDFRFIATSQLPVGWPWRFLFNMMRPARSATWSRLCC